jgi:CheY-like chemotaxis protein
MESVLFVDDDNDFLANIKRRFDHLNRNSMSRRKFESTICSTVSDAIIILEERSFDVIVTDLCMPVIDGAQFLRILSRLLPHTPKIVLTAYPDPNLRAECVEAGASLFLLKPASPDEFYSIYAVILEMLENSSKSDMSGVLPMATLSDVLQMICSTGGSAVFEVKVDGKTGQIYVERGRVVHAKLGSHAGGMALMRMTASPETPYSVSAFQEPAERSMEMSLQEAASGTRETVASVYPKPSVAVSPPPAGGVSTDEFLACSPKGEVLKAYGGINIGARLSLLEFFSTQARYVADVLGSSPIRSIEIYGVGFRAAASLQPDRSFFGLTRDTSISPSRLLESGVQLAADKENPGEQ